MPLGLLMLAGAICGRGKTLRRARVALVLGFALLALMVGFEIFRRLSNAYGA